MEITISLLHINKFKGLRQDIDYPELPLNYCHVSQNLNMDDPAGSLRVRGGSVQYYNTALTGYPFTSLISAFEYRFEESSETVLIVNDNGTLKTMTDGAAPASLTLPTGATMEASFQNYYMGNKDNILITTGNAATNYLLWYGYVNRVAADGTGLFGNAEEKTGYIFTKSQLITPNGVFSGVYNVVYVGGYYWMSFNNSTYIEKRNTSFQLVDRFTAVNNQVGGNHTASANTPIALATDGTYIYVAYNINDEAKSFAWYKADPAGFARLAGAATLTIITQTVQGIATDGTNVFICTDVRLYSDVVGGGSLTEESTLTAAKGVATDNTATNAGRVFVLYAAKVDVRLKIDLNVVDASSVAYLAQTHIEYQDNAPAQSYIFVSSTTGNGHVYKFEDDDLTTVVDNTKIYEPGALIKLLGVDANIRGISTSYGTVEKIAAEDTEYPQLVGLNFTGTAVGSLVAGTYFYKISIEDLNGQYYTLSDPIVVINTAGTLGHKIRIICHEDQLTDNSLYRVKNIHIFRAYNEETDIGVPSTDYKFLKTVDINSASWVNDATTTIYYYDYTDNTTEDIISTTTFLETSGIDDTVKPRYINGKYFTFINNQLHLANFSHDGDTYRNRVIRSADSAPDAISFYDYYDFDVGIGEAINGITEMFGRSIVFKERKMGVFYDGRWEKTFEPGAHNSHSFYKVNDVLYYVSLRGIHAFNGAKLINIHYPVIDLFDSIDKDVNPPNVFFIDGRDRIYFTMASARVLVYNVKYDTWTDYSSGMAFKGFFKNYAGDYIGWKSDVLYEIEDNTSVNDGEDYGGGNGTAITVTYESPLIRLSGIDGETAIPISHRHRVLKDVAVGSTDLITFTLYEYQDDASGKTSVYTQAIDSPVGSYAAVKSYFFDPILGESFSVKLNGAIDGGNFIYHGLTIEYEQAGYWDGR